MITALNFSTCILLVELLFSLSCKKEYSCEGCAEKNKPPIAVTGPDQVITLPTDSVSLDGRSSSDPDGKISAWLWTKISGPVSFNIDSTTIAKTVVKNLVVGIYRFELKVTDDGGLSGKDTLQIDVNDPSQPNRPPIANAGADETIMLPATTTAIDGSGSTDPDNNITNYAWTKISGPTSFNITNWDAVQTQVTNLVEGTYQFELKVTDVGGLFSLDTIKVAVIFSNNTSCSNRPIITAQLVPIGNLSEGRYSLSVATAGNKVLFAGGFIPNAYSTRVDIYDFVANSWSTAELSLGRQGMATASVGNKIFFAGGGDNDVGVTTSRVDIYDVSTNRWSVAELSKDREYMAAATIGDRVFFAGGGNWDNNYYAGTDRVDIYNNSSNSWTTASLSEGRSSLTANTAGNKIFFAGGNSSINISTKIDIYDTLTNSWSTSSLQRGRMFHAGINVGNKIYWASGINSFSSSGYTESDLVEIRDINTEVSSFACMIPKSQFTAVVKGYDIVFFTGYPGNTIQFDIYNTITNTWSTGVLSQSINAAAVISVNNTIYVAGGTNNGSGYYNQVWKLEF